MCFIIAQIRSLVNYEMYHFGSRTGKTFFINCLIIGAPKALLRAHMKWQIITRLIKLIQVHFLIPPTLTPHLFIKLLRSKKVARIKLEH